jgi:antitoxin (DNA-binding transcriptional repressor) of toxin-antitoxin stability system
VRKQTTIFGLSSYNRRQMTERAATMSIGMTELADHTSDVLRKLRSSRAGVLVTRRHKDVLVALLPPSAARHALEIPVRRLSRQTYSVINEVRKRGETATVTSRGKPVADIRPVDEEAARRFAATTAANSRAFMESLRGADKDLAAGRAVTLDDELIESLPKEGVRTKKRQPPRSTPRRTRQGLNPRTAAGSARKTTPAAARKGTSPRRKTAQRAK